MKAQVSQGVLRLYFLPTVLCVELPSTEEGDAGTSRRKPTEHDWDGFVFIVNMLHLHWSHIGSQECFQGKKINEVMWERNQIIYVGLSTWGQLLSMSDKL